MTLAGGADIKINGVDYQVDTSIDDAFVHQFETLLSPRTDISGAPGKQQLREDILLWTFDDWSGGEGNAIYYPDEPTKYDFSVGTNTRSRGRLTGRPANAVEYNATPRDIRRPHIIAFGANRIWHLGAGESTDGPLMKHTGAAIQSSFSILSSGVMAWDTNSDRDIYSAAGDGDYLYAAAYSGDVPNWEVRRFKNDGTNTFTSERMSLNSGHEIPASMQFLGRMLYIWTGRKLYQYDVYSGTVPLASGDKTTVYNAGHIVPATWLYNSTWFADMIAGENQLFFFFSGNGVSKVYQASFDETGTIVPAPLWTPPRGFTVRSIAYTAGVLYVAGHWGYADDVQFGQVWGIFTQNRTVVPIADVRSTTGEAISLNLAETTYGGKVIFAAGKTGEVFVLDPETNALSVLVDLDADMTNIDIGTYEVSDMATIGNYRTFLFNAPSAANPTAQQLRWALFKNDEEANQQANVTGQYAESGDWDFDFPHERKALLGFYVGFEPLVAGQRIKVEYSIDGAAFVSAGTIISTTEGASQGRVYLPVSTASTDGTGTKKFYKLRFRTYVESLSGSVVPPTVNSVTAEARLMARRQVWRIAVRIKNEQSSTRPRGRQWNAEKLRENILTAVENEAIVEFVDGYSTLSRNVDPDTYNVIIEDPTEVIDRNGEGYMLVTLKEVPH